MTLTLVYRLNGLVGLLWAASMWFGTDMMAASYGWEVPAPMVTMSEFLAMSFLFIGVIFIMIGQKLVTQIWQHIPNQHKLQLRNKQQHQDPADRINLINKYFFIFMSYAHN